MRLHEPDGYECRFGALMAVPSARRDRVGYAVSAGRTAHPGRLIDVTEAAT